MTTRGKWVTGSVIAFIGLCILVVLSAVEESSTSSADLLEGCIEVSRERLDGIQAGLNVSSGFLREGWAYRSGAHENAYFVAAEVDGPGMEGDGHDLVYFVTSLDSRGLTLSVDEVAIELSDWPDGAMMEARTSASDPGVAEARTCLRQAQSRR